MNGSTCTHYTLAPTLSVSIGDARLAYRDLGLRHATPVVLLNHWGATLDNFDPSIVDALAAKHRVITVNYRGIGKSTGTLPHQIAKYSDDIIAFARALGLAQIDLFGFSLGGFVAQDVALKQPALVRRLILTGTGSAGMYRSNILLCTWLIVKSVLTFRDPKFYLFFPSTVEGKQAAKGFLRRIHERKTDRDKNSGLIHYARQLFAIRAWERQLPQDLGQIKAPTLIVNGDNDLMVPSSQSTSMAKRIPNAELILYHASGHGAIFQYHAQFTAKLLEFLSATEKA